MNSVGSLWPDVDDILNFEQNNPVNILKEQATIIESYSDNIEASVISSVHGEYTLYLTGRDCFFEAAIIRISALRDSNYPITAYALTSDRHGCEIETVADFKAFLSKAFNSPMCIEMLKFLCLQSDSTDRPC